MDLKLLQKLVFDLSNKPRINQKDKKEIQSYILVTLREESGCIEEVHGNKVVRLFDRTIAGICPDKDGLNRIVPFGNFKVVLDPEFVSIFEPSFFWTKKCPRRKQQNTG